MAGLNINPDAIAKARQSGYSDDEIVSFLSERAPEQFKQAHDAGYTSSEILNHFGGSQQEPSGSVKALQKGFADLFQGAGDTAHVFTGADTGIMDTAANRFAPKDYKPAQIVPEDGHWYNPLSYNWSQVPQAVAEAAPGVAQDLVAARAGSKVGGAKAGLAAGLASMALRTLGRTAKEDATIRTGKADAEPETQDKLRALGTTAVQAVPFALGLSRFLPGAGAAVKTAGGAVGRAAGTAGVEAGVNAAQDAIGQAGATIGTDKGLTVDPNRLVQSAIVGGVGGGILSAPRAGADAYNARRFKETDTDTDAATALANRMQAAANGETVSPSVGADAMRTAGSDIKNELSAALKTAKAGLPKGTEPFGIEASNILKRAKSGQVLSERDLDTLNTQAVPDQVITLVRQANALAKLKELGDFRPDTFKGGITALAEKKIRAYNNPVGVGAASLAAGLGGAGAVQALGTYSPLVLAPLAAGYGGLRMLDALTGSRSPAKTFIERYANDTPQGPQMGPWGPRDPNNTADPGTASGPTGPVPPAPRPLDFDMGPWGMRERSPQTAVPPVSLTDYDMGPWGPRDRPVGSGVSPDAFPKLPTLEERIQLPDALKTTLKAQMGFQRMKEKTEQSEAKAAQKAVEKQQKAEAAQQQPVPTVDPLRLPKDITGPARTLMKALAQAAQMRQTYEGNQQAEALARVSPLVEGVGGYDAVANPDMPARASKIISAANAIKKLTAEPDAEAAAEPGTQVATPPVIETINKKLNGNKSAKEADADSTSELPYEPLVDEALWRTLLNDRQVAVKELADYDPIVREKYAKKVASNRATKRQMLEDLAMEADPADAKVMAALYAQLDHISRRLVASQAIVHYTAQMTPEGAAAVKAAFTPNVLKKLWSQE